jgi:hypothetical protein
MPPFASQNYRASSIRPVLHISLRPLRNDVFTGIR